MTDVLALRDNAKQQLAEIKTIETGINYLNKVKAIEVWAKAEKKDAELQNMIAEQKIRTQRILGQLLKESEVSKNVSNQYLLGQTSQPSTLQSFGITKDQSSAFQKIAAIPEQKFEEFIQEKKTAVNDAVAELTTAGILRMAKGAHVSNNSGENEWYTPSRFIESARIVMGIIDLDPASSALANENVKASTYFDEKTNGLEQVWFGNIWMNPPYAQPLISFFIDKLESETYNQAIVLVNNATETKWGSKLLKLCSVVCFPTSRIRFIDTDGNEGEAPLQGQMIAYIGSDKNKFTTEFAKYGICLINEG